MNTAVGKSPISRGVIQICSQPVEWYLNGRGHQLSDFDVEHIQNMLIDNYVEGNLCSITTIGNTVSGYWSIRM